MDPKLQVDGSKVTSRWIQSYSQKWGLLSPKDQAAGDISKAVLPGKLGGKYVVEHALPYSTQSGTSCFYQFEVVGLEYHKMGLN